MIRYASMLVLFFLLVSIFSILFYPPISPILGIVTLLFSLAISTYAIVHKHTGTEHVRAKILKEVGVMVLTLVIIIFLGGIASMLANYHTSMRWGAAAGLMSAIAASFLIGYIVRAGMMRSGILKTN